MGEDAIRQLAKACQQVLEQNQNGGYTMPAGALYPHQWLWDSCFIAIGLAHYDVDRAQTELLSLLRGQWANGMLPNMIFASGDEHQRDRTMWQSHRSSNAPDNLQTSGITQPPMLAEAIVRVGKALSREDRRRWYQRTYPALLAYHKWLYRERDPRKEGLVLLVHPWESGLDNTPPWMNQLYRYHYPWWTHVVKFTRLDALVSILRRDTLHVSPGERISNIEALLYYDVVRVLRNKNYEIETILKRNQFVVQDLTYNCILLRAHTHLTAIAKATGYNVPEWLEERVHRGKKALQEQLWDQASGQFYSRNFVTRELIKEPSIATLMPLYAGVCDETQEKSLLRLVKSRDNFSSPFPIPSVPVSYSAYKELLYWQGPTWLNTNWLVHDGLVRAGHDAEAHHVLVKSLELVHTSGAYEYFSAKTAAPAGAKNFSWTAALCIDFIAQLKR